MFFFFFPHNSFISFSSAWKFKKGWMDGVGGGRVKHSGLWVSWSELLKTVTPQLMQPQVWFLFRALLRGLRVSGPSPKLRDTNKQSIAHFASP